MMDYELPNSIFEDVRVKLENLDSNESLTNPWDVNDVANFLHYCCPECEFQTQELDQFGDHARLEHVQSQTLFKPEKTLILEPEFNNGLKVVKGQKAQELLSEVYAKDSEENYENLHMLKANRVVEPVSEELLKAVEKRFGETGLELQHLEVLDGPNASNTDGSRPKLIVVSKKRKFFMSRYWYQIVTVVS